MKNITILSLILSSVLSLTACGMLDGYGQEAGANGKSNFFKNARGENVWTCKRDVIHAGGGHSYLRMYNLPPEIGGNFICDGDTPKLPKDCQGREIRSEAEFIAFWQRHQFPIGLPYYDCVNGVPKVKAEHLQYWKIKEEQNPTCKDARGHKRPCV